MIAFYIFEWYVLILIISSLSFIITFDLFKNLEDKGYCLSKIIGISILSFFSLMISLFNIFNLDFKTISYLSLILLTIYSIFRIIKTHKVKGLKEIYKFIDTRYKFIILAEFTFLGIIMFGSYVRAFFPDLLGVYKINELGYIKSIINSTTLFPDNLWLSGFSLVKNFLGYYILSNLISIYPQNMEIVLNIVPSTILAILALLSGSIVYNTLSNKSYGVLATILVTFLGNFETLSTILKEGLANNFNWWQTANFFEDKIFTEFPLWTALFGDIEPYFISSIYLAAILSLLLLAIKEDMFLVNNKITSKTLYLSGIMIIMSYFCWAINYYSSIILIVFSFCLLIFLIAKYNKDKEKFKLYSIIFATVFILSILPSLYFLVSFHNNIGLMISNETYLNSFNLFKMVGVYIIPIIIFALLLFKRITKISIKECILITIILLSFFQIIESFKLINNFAIALLISLTLLLIIVLSILRLKEFTNNSDKTAFYIMFSMLTILLTLIIVITNNILILTIMLLLLPAILLAIEKRNLESIVTTYALISVSIFLLVCNYLKFDNDSTINNRIISFLISQMLFIFPLITVFIIYQTNRILNIKFKETYKTILSLVFIPAFLFAIFGTYSMAHKFSPIEGLIPNLSGYNHIMVFHEGDYSAIEWIKSNLKPGTIIIEAIKENLPYSGRISAYSGSSTILQRPEEQAFLYGSKIKPMVEQRAKDLDKIYNEEDKQSIIHLLKKYNVDYIYIGEIEKEKYPIKSLESFSQIASVAYNSGKSVIYRLSWSSVN